MEVLPEVSKEKSRKIVKAIVRKMREQLMAGKNVSLPGMGILKVYTTRATKKVSPLIMNGKIHKEYSEVFDVPSRRTVIFELHRNLSRMLDE